MKESIFVKTCVKLKEKENGEKWLTKELSICFIISIIICGCSIIIKPNIIKDIQYKISYSEEDFLNIKDVLSNKILTEDGFNDEFLEKNNQYSFDIERMEGIGLGNGYKVTLSQNIGKKLKPEINAIVTENFKMESYKFNFDTVKDCERLSKIIVCFECLIVVFLIAAFFFILFYIVITGVNFYINK